MELAQSKLYTTAWHLALFTIFYNIIEGVVSMAMGYSDETIALFGFGVDSFIEVLSGIGIAVMIKRIKNAYAQQSKVQFKPVTASQGNFTNSGTADDGENIPAASLTPFFERTALRITGTAFYLLSVGLAAGIIVNLINGHKPETTIWGIFISAISIVVMYWLMYSKRKTGKALNSSPIIADANCTKVCIYMSVVLLISSLIYELTGFAYADVIGAVGLIWFSISEGREAFEKAEGKSCECGHC